jgi:WD40 repeat protein
LAGACNGLSFSEDSKTLVAATLSPDDQIILWSVADGNVLQTVPAPQLTGPMIQRTTFAVTPDLRVAAHVTASGQLRVVDLKSGRERWVAEGADKGSVVGRITFSADGRLIASTAYLDDQAIRVWDAASGKLIQKLHPGNRLLTFALLFWPDGNTLATGGYDQTIRIWDVPSGKQIDMLQGHKAFVTGLALLPDNTTLVSGAWDGVVSLWNARSRRHEEARIELPEPIGAWRFAEDGRSLLTAASNGRITRWQGNDFSERIVELEAGPIVADWRMGQEQFSPDLRYVALQRVEGQVEVWDTFAHRLCQKFDGAIEIFPVVHFRDNHTVRVFDQRSTDSIRCREWDLQNGGVTKSWQIPTHAPLPSVGSTLAWKSPPGTMPPSFLVATFSADGERCLISSAARKAVVYNLRRGAGEFADVGARCPPQFSPDGNLLAGRRGFDIKLWETATFREIATLPAWTKAPTSVAFSPNGARLAVGNGPGSEGVVLWNPQNYEPVLTLVGNGGGFRGTAFSPDGSRLGSRSTFVPDGDGSLHVWRAPTWEEIEAAEKRATSSRTVP